MLGNSSDNYLAWTGQRRSLAKPLEPPQGSRSCLRRDLRLSLYPRALKHAVRTLNLNMVLSWVRHKPGTWETRNTKDPVLNKLEAKSIVPSIRTDVLMPILVFVWSLIPETLQLRLRQNGLRRFVASLIGVT